MPAIALLSAVFVVGFEQLVQWRYGPTGILGLLQVVRDQIPVVTFVADDGVARYTGGQPHPG